MVFSLFDPQCRPLLNGSSGPFAVVSLIRCKSESVVQHDHVLMSQKLLHIYFEYLLLPALSSRITLLEMVCTKMKPM